MAKSNAKKYTDVADIIASKANKVQLQTFVDEVIKAKERIKLESEHIKDVREAAVDKLNIDPKRFNGLVKMFFNNDFLETRSECEDTIDVIDAFAPNVGSDSDE